jgi:hypothetical protein
MSDKRYIADQKIREVKGVLIQASKEPWWEYNNKELIAYDDNSTPDVQYVAFYRTAPVSAITHFAQVIYTEKNALPREFLATNKDMLAKVAEENSLDKPKKLYYLKRIIELPHKIEKDKNHGIKSKWIKTIAQLLAARTLSDLEGEEE